MGTKKRQPQRQAVPLTPVIAAGIRAAHAGGNTDLSGLSIEFGVTLTDVQRALASEDSGTTNAPPPPPAEKPTRQKRQKRSKATPPTPAAEPTYEEARASMAEEVLHQLAQEPAPAPQFVTVSPAGPGATAIVIDPSAVPFPASASPPAPEPAKVPQAVRASLTGEAWRAIVFADLHVSAETLTRCVEVLRRLRIMAVEHNVDHVVFLGDWWDRAGHLPTRVLHALLEELRAWERDVVRLTLIPGNHDHVSVDGSIHGAEVFGAFRNVTVVTDPIHDDEARCAYLPWREDPAEQAALFAAVPDGWTVFGHAELPGATTNHHHAATGRVAIGDLLRFRATYCGHYHLRQRIAPAAAWYIGNPYEKDAGEAGQPKGCAFVDSTAPEPVWVDWSEAMPRFLTIRLGSADPMPIVKPSDTVDVVGALDDLKRPEVTAWMKSIQAARVRPRPLAETTKDTAPQFAADVDLAMAQIAGDDAAVIEVGRSILAEATKGAVVGGAPQDVRLRSVEATNFCRLRGTFALDLDRAGLLLVKGPIGSGKTALLDAITWCLYDTTTPRKAGAMGASLTGDEVINDDASEASVTVRLLLGGEPNFGGGEAEVTITRTKRRGKGSRVTVEGAQVPDGIRDGDDLARWLIGYDYSLWRSACSLGQGAVASFVTATDKARKELLSGLVPGLAGVAPAREEAKARHRAVSMRLDKARLDVANAQGIARALRESSFEADAKRWDDEQAARLATATASLDAAREKIGQIEAALASEPQWRESAKQYQDYADTLTRKLSEVRSGDPSKHQRVGALRAELSVVERDIALGTQKLADITARASAASTCPTCGQEWNEHGIAHHEQQVSQGLQAMRGTEYALRAQLSDAEAAVAADAQLAHREVAGLEDALAGARAQIGAMASTLNRFTELRAELRTAKEAAAVATATIGEIERAVNPWREKQREQAEKLAAHDEAIARLLVLIAEGEEQARCLAVWIDGFGPKGVIALVLRTVVYALQEHANRYLAAMYGGTLHAVVSIDDDTIGVGFWEWARGEWRARRYEQLSGGQRRLVELAFSPLALADVARQYVSSINALFVDELTTHLSPSEKGSVVALLASLVEDRVVDTIVVVDHDLGVQDSFTHVLEMQGDALVRVGGKSE